MPNAARTRVVNVRREKCDVLITRQGIFGNPFKIGRDGDRAQVIDRYYRWVIFHPTIISLILEQRGKRLGCVCKPLACHGDIIAGIADRKLDIQTDFSI